MKKTKPFILSSNTINFKENLAEMSQKQLKI